MWGCHTVCPAPLGRSPSPDSMLAPPHIHWLMQVGHRHAVSLLHDEVWVGWASCLQTQLGAMRTRSGTAETLQGS